MNAEHLAAEAIAISGLDATVISATDIGSHAIEYAVNTWRVFPLHGKVPFASPHPGGSQGREHKECAARCGHPGHGVLSATNDIDAVTRWWGGRYTGANIGGRVPESMFVLDIDPRHDGDGSIAELEQRHGRLPETLTTISGRGDGGRHLFFRRPSGNLSSKRLGPGLDLKTHTGYVVLAPSIHPDTGKPYARIDRAVALAPAWLVGLLKPEQPPCAPPSPRRHLYALHAGPSVADQFTIKASWSAILTPHGWHCPDPDSDPDADGARWLHPNATSSCSATVRHGCLFVYSPNTPFEVTESGNPHGYTKFRAFAVLDYGGDLSAAAKALRTGAAK